VIQVFLFNVKINGVIIIILFKVFKDKKYGFQNRNRSELFKAFSKNDLRFSSPLVTESLSEDVFPVDIVFRIVDLRGV